MLYGRDSALIFDNDADLFVLRLGEGSDDIFGFENGTDMIGLSGLNFSDILVSSAGADTVISAAFSGETLAVLHLVDSALIGSNDFELLP